VDTIKPARDSQMGEKKLETIIHPEQAEALAITDDQPAAKRGWHRLEDFALKSDPLSDAEFKEFMDAINNLRRAGTPKSPFED
jgi:hypothetical protein